MSWRQSTGRDDCNRCRRVVDLGAALYVGEHAPSTWCEPCAAEVFGKSPDGPVPKVRSVSGASTFDPKAIGARLRAAILARRKGLVVIGGE